MTLNEKRAFVGLEAIKEGDKIFGNNLEKQAEKDTYEKYSQ